MKTKQDKGHKAQFELLVDSLKKEERLLFHLRKLIILLKLLLRLLKVSRRVLGSIWIHLLQRMVLF